MQFKLTPKPVPSPKKADMYEAILDAFAKSKNSSVVVQGTNKKPSTLHQGLLKAKRGGDYKDISVKRRADEVFLTK